MSFKSGHTNLEPVELSCPCARSLNLWMRFLLIGQRALMPPRARARERKRERGEREREGGRRGREGETWGSTIRYRCPLTGGGSAVNHGKACANKAWSVCHRDCRLQWEHRVETTNSRNGRGPPGGTLLGLQAGPGSHFKLLDWELTRGYFTGLWVTVGGSGQS